MFESLWLESALDQLAVIYIALDTHNRARLAEGVERLNSRLAFDPLDVGESRAGGFRVAFTLLLMVYFFVDDMKRRVRVTDVVAYGH